MPNKDYYQILGLDKNASADQIKDSFRALAKKYHPDVSKEPDAEVKFKEIQEAYSVLSDPDKKQKYDTYGSAEGPDVSGFGGFGGFGFNPFGGFGQRRGPIKEQGEDLKIHLSLDLDEIYDGVHKKIRVKKQCACHRCHGSGSETNQTETCPECNGTGVVREAQQTAFGYTQTIRPCSHCHGTGTVIKDPCPNCKGTGLEEMTKEIEFDVPPGMPNDSYFVIQGQGNDGAHQGIPGDLIVIISENKNGKGLYRDEENNLCYNLTAKLTDLIYGSEVEVPWVKGYKKIKLTPGTQIGETIIRYGEGFPNPNNPLGPKSNYKIFVDCKIPKEKDLYGTNKECFDKIKKEGKY